MADRPLILVVNDNRAMEELVPVLHGFCELTAACDPDSVVSLPSRDVLPFQNLSPHPEIQEERATALWKIATGEASIVVAPVAATAIRLRSAEYYSDLARIFRRGESFDIEPYSPPEHRRLFLGRRGRNAGPIRFTRRHSRCVFA